jgi:hypothetical protein
MHSSRTPAAPAGHNVPLVKEVLADAVGPWLLLLLLLSLSLLLLLLLSLSLSLLLLSNGMLLVSVERLEVH